MKKVLLVDLFEDLKTSDTKLFSQCDSEDTIIINSYYSESLTFSQKLDLTRRIRAISTPAAVHLFMIAHPLEERTKANNITDLYNNWIGPFIKLRLKYKFKAKLPGMLDGDTVSPITIRNELINHHGYKSIKVPDKSYYGDLLDAFLFKLEIYLVDGIVFNKTSFYDHFDELLKWAMRKSDSDKVKVS